MEIFRVCIPHEQCSGKNKHLWLPHRMELWKYGLWLHTFHCGGCGGFKLHISRNMTPNIERQDLDELSMMVRENIQ